MKHLCNPVLVAAAILALVTAVVGCSSSDPPPPAQPQPQTIVKMVDGQPVTFGMVDGAHGSKVFFRMDDAYQCDGDSCDPCAGGGCIINGGCPCYRKDCAGLCLQGAPLPVPEDEAMMLTSARGDLRDAMRNRDTFDRRINELENRIRDLETTTPRR